MNKTIWRIIFCVNWVIILGFWWANSGNLIFGGLQGAMISLGRLAGLGAVYLILLQFFYMGRTPYLERVFGLDKLSIIHHRSGRWGFLILILHPIFLSFGYGGFSLSVFLSQISKFINNFEGVSVAAFALILFFVVIVSSIYIVRRKARYEYWYFIHLIVYLAIFMSLGHQFEIGSDLLASRIFYLYWIFLYIFVFANHVLFRFVRPIFNFYRHRFSVSRVVQENHNTTSIYIGGKDLDKFKIRAGQFIILRFLAKNFWYQAHPFSLSIMPEGGELRVTIKDVGDFTSQVQGVKVGTKVLVDGPYGVFINTPAISEKVLMIAGGIGITPIRSLAEEFLKDDKDVVILYSIRTEKDIVFKEELEKITSNCGGRIIFIVTNQDNFRGEKGKLDLNKIKDLVPDISSREIFLCGPPSMMGAIILILKKLKISTFKLHFERFAMG